ncbi:TetR/AcrR family transcriptional regulator [Ferdinandcohnia sp. Marseille-Q9671]
MARERKFTTEELFQGTEELLLKHHYEGFQISLIADHLDVSRGAIYKYYENKEELITEYMLYKMEQFLIQLKRINAVDGAENQLDFLLGLMFENPELHQLIEIGKRIPDHINQKVKENMDKLERLRIQMYHHMGGFIEQGKKEQRLNLRLPEPLMLGYIFQSIAIPNHFGIPRDKWVNSIKEIICHGIFRDS